MFLVHAPRGSILYNCELICDQIRYDKPQIHAVWLHNLRFHDGHLFNAEPSLDFAIHRTDSVPTRWTKVGECHTFWRSWFVTTV